MKLIQKPVNELTDEEVRLIVGRQNWLEENILGNQIESREYVFWSNGGISQFWKRWVWDWLDYQEAKKTHQNVSNQSREVFLGEDEL